MSFKPQVQTDEPGKFYSNAQCFATEEEADRAAYNLMRRWYAVTDYRVIESTDPVNYAIVDDREERLILDPLVNEQAFPKESAQ